MQKKNTNRMQKVDEEFKREIGRIIDQDLKNTNITGLISVTKVKVAPDLKSARVYVSLLNCKSKKNTLDGLKSATGYIRTELAKRINLRYTPSITFELDDTMEYGARIDSILNDIIPKETEEGGEMTLDNILEEIKKAEKIVILTHETPDGDAIGSSLAMKHAIKTLGKEADLIIPEYSECFDFLPGISEIKKESDVQRYDLGIALDCADNKILKGNDKYFENAKMKIVIDHHGSNKMYGDINFVNPVSPACCEVLVGMFDYFGLEMTKEIGTCIITGIVTDTGGFDYNVTAETFDFAAMLLRKGVNISEAYRKALRTKTRPSFELKKIANERLEFLEDGKVTFTYITLEDEENVNAKTGDHEGLVENGRDIEGVEVSIFLHQKEGKSNGFKLSLRSSEYVNVADICLMFGGGGHPKAAGAFVNGSVEQIKEKVLLEIRKQLK